MPLILAIEPDRHQAAQIAAIAQGRIGAELVLADSADRALRALGNRVPDLILTPQLLSPRDDEAITDRLRALGTAATFVQTLTIPALATAQPGAASRTRGLLSALRRQKAAAPAPNGCAPDVFAEQITVYLERALEARKAHGDAEPTSPIEADAVASGFSRKEDTVDVASGFSRKEDTVDVASGSEWKEPLLEPEWPVTRAAEATVPTVDLWEPWQPAIAEAPIEESVAQPEVATSVLLNPDHGSTIETDLVAAADIARPMPERTIDPEWPAPTAVAPVAEEVAIEFVGSVESIAPVEIVAPVEATVPTAESASRRHTEEQLISERTPVDEGKAGLVARFMARLRPVSTPTAAVVEARSAIEGSNGPATDAPELVRPVEAGPADEPTATEFERPLELAKPAWVETDLTELVDAIAEPADDPELVIPSDVRPTDSVVELPSLDDARDALTLREPQGHPEQGRGVSDIRQAPPAPTVQVPEAPPPAASRPKATRPANRKRRARPAPKDDWHFFDPEETRFAALLAKLDEITGTDAASHS